MEFNYDCLRALNCNADGFSVLEGSYQKGIKPAFIPYVSEIIDKMGYASSKAQGLSTIITTSYKFFNSDHRMFIRAVDNKVIGFIKVGVKKLFLRDTVMNYHEVSPLCVLDFYVYEGQQRSGQGKALFEFMLNFENVDARSLAYDRPSSKLIGFLKKHYSLVFNDFFMNMKSKTERNMTKLNMGNNLSNVGQQLIYNNSHLATPEGKPGEIFHQPTKLFSSYYLNQQNTNYYDQIYSKKKINLLNDYIQTDKKEVDVYVRDQFEKREKEIYHTQSRLNHLAQNILPSTNGYDVYNKRYQYATVFDNHKIIEKEARNLYGCIKVESPYKNNPVKTCILPTTSSAYGAYYKTTLNEQNKLDNKFTYNY